MQPDTVKDLKTKLAYTKNENQQLRNEIERLNDLLMQLNDKLEDAEKFKTHFISNVTNELINPFTSIICLAKSILSADKQDWKTIISMIALIHAETFTLELQLKNILNAARLEAGLMYVLPEKSDIKHVILSLHEDFKHELRKRRIELKRSFSVAPERKDKDFFITDSEKVHVIVSNLLNNAIKFSKDDSEVIIDVNVSSDKMEIKITDYGIGVPEKDRETIFNRFVRLDNEINSLNPGQGLGLSICKGIIDLFEGSIKVFSNKGRGAIFVVTLPEQQNVFEGYSFNTNETFFDIDEVL